MKITHISKTTAFPVKLTLLDAGKSILFTMTYGSFLYAPDKAMTKSLNIFQRKKIVEITEEKLPAGFEYFKLYTEQVTVAEPEKKKEKVSHKKKPVAAEVAEAMNDKIEAAKEFFKSETILPTSYAFVMETIFGFSKPETKLILKQKNIVKKTFPGISEKDFDFLKRKLDESFKNKENAPSKEPTVLEKAEKEVREYKEEEKPVEKKDGFSWLKKSHHKKEDPTPPPITEQPDDFPF